MMLPQTRPLLLLAVWSAAACGSRERTLSSGPHTAESTGGITTGGVSLTGAGSSVGAGGNEAVIVDPSAPCDQDLALDSTDPIDGARALGICKHAQNDKDWGLIAARFARVNGDPPPSGKTFELGHGLLDRFGKIAPREGERLLSLSSGTARDPKDTGFASPAGFDKGYESDDSNELSKTSPSCPDVQSGATHDDVALELELRPPEGAHSFAFEFDFFTYEWPEWVCSSFNDYFVALLDPIPKGLKNGNISFDQAGNPVNVNNALVRVCDCAPRPPCDAPPSDPVKSYGCSQGDAHLAGTGFEGHAATNWLVTKVPVRGGEVVRLRLGVLDSGDGVLDSTTLIDEFRWLGDSADAPETVPEPD